MTTTSFERQLLLTIALANYAIANQLRFGKCSLIDEISYSKF